MVLSSRVLRWATVICCWSTRLIENSLHSTVIFHHQTSTTTRVALNVMVIRDLEVDIDQRCRAEIIRSRDGVGHNTCIYPHLLF